MSLFYSNPLNIFSDRYGIADFLFVQVPLRASYFNDSFNSLSACRFGCPPFGWAGVFGNIINPGADWFQIVVTSNGFSQMWPSDRLELLPDLIPLGSSLRKWDTVSLFYTRHPNFSVCPMSVFQTNCLEIVLAVALRFSLEQLFSFIVPTIFCFHSCCEIQVPVHFFFSFYGVLILSVFSYQNTSF